MVSSPQLLLVNSDEKMRYELSSFISSSTDFEVLESSDGHSAIQVLQATDVACIVSDIFIDDFDGWRLARLVRAGDLYCHAQTPFIIVSNSGCERSTQITAREVGVDYFIPFHQYHRLASVLNDFQMSLLPQSVFVPSVLVIAKPENSVSVAGGLSSYVKTETVSNIKAGFERWRTGSPAVVVIDLTLTECEMSLATFIRQVRSERPSQAIIALADTEMEALIPELMLQGISDSLKEPYTAEQLINACHRGFSYSDFMLEHQEFLPAKEVQKEHRLVLATSDNEGLSVLNSLLTSVIALDSEGQIVFINRAFLTLTGLSSGEIYGRLLSDFACETTGDSQTVVNNAISILLSNRTSRYSLEFKLADKYNQGGWIEARFSRIFRDDTSVAITVSLDDISQRKQTEQQLKQLAVHDPLTGVYNRIYFESELARIVELANQGATQHCLLYIDLDHFKAINDTKGHPQGDAILKSVAALLQSRLRDSDQLCRIAGDEFAVLLMDTDLLQGKLIANTFCDLIANHSFTLFDSAIKISCSIGLSEIGLEQLSSQIHLQRADIALYLAKRHGRNCVHLYSEEDEESDDVKRSMEWLHTVKHAIEQDQLILHYQPIYDVESNQIEYYEALVRLNIEDQIVYPGDFIPALERFEDISLLDQHVINMVIRHLSQYPQLCRAAINLSAQAFRNADVVPFIEDKLSTYNVSPERVIFELTESASLTNLAATQEMVQKISDMGCSFSIDDFGTGFSTFSYLKSLPAQTVKIDGSFIRELTHSPVDLALVKAIREVATAVGKKTVAEFVEDQETLNLLRDIKVDYAQGYHLGRPQPLEQLFNSDEVELVLAFD